MVESMFPPGPINPRQLDPERVNGLLAHGVETHPNRAEVDRFLRAGAEFIVGRADDDPELLRVRLVMTDKAPAMAELRASIAGTTAPGTASDAPATGAELVVIDAPARELRRVNRG